MPLVPFSSLPSTARVWVFGSDVPLTGAVADTLLAEVDKYLDQWKAHGAPLKAAREWREDRFLIVGVDPTDEQASGCSIDALFRVLQQLQRTIGATLVGGGRVFFRGPDRQVKTSSRPSFEMMIEDGAITPTTPVFDTSVTRLDEWREKFERPLAESWAASLK